MVPEAPAKGEVVFGQPAIRIQADLAASPARGDNGPFLVVAEGEVVAGEPELADQSRRDRVEFVVL